MPVKIGGYTDFYASKEHATNIGKIFRPDNPLLPNWVHLPIAYNGRASSVRLSGYPLKRPQGQILVDGKPQFSLTKKVDLEVELGIIIGKNSNLGEPIPIDQAEDYIFGICVVNDWSLRDIQAWEYQPLGPFNSKSVLTSISAFITPIEELEIFKVPLKPQNPEPTAYLADPGAYTYDIKFDVSIKTPHLLAPYKISEVNFKDIYWSIKQMIAQHTITGCNLCVGDLIASGTISGEGIKHAGSLMEITVNGTNPLILPNGETREFLLDGDELIIEAYNDSTKERIDLGVVTGKVIT
jgi:fumarylacetoacetase